MCSEDFLLDASDRRDFASQSDLSSHSQCIIQRVSREQTDHGHDDRNSRRGTFFLDGPSWHVEMEVDVSHDVFFLIVRQSELVCICPDPAQSELTGFRNDISERTGQTLSLKSAYATKSVEIGVLTRLPFPGKLVISIRMISPFPDPVYARPLATPGLASSSSSTFSNS